MDQTILSRLTETYLLKLCLGKTSESVLKEFTDSDVKVEHLTRVLSKNQAYEHFFRRFMDPPGAKRLVEKAAESLKNQSKNQEEIKDSSLTDEKKGVPDEVQPPLSLERMVLLFGMVGARNLILNLQYIRQFEDSILREADKDLVFKPLDYLTFARKSESFCLENNVGFPELAYVGGLLFDWLSGLESSRLNRKRFISPYHQTIWTQSVQVGWLSDQLCRKLQVFGLARFAFVSGLVHQVGKLLLSQIHSDPQSSLNWNRFVSETEKLPVPIKDFVYLEERKRYLLSHNEISALCLRFFPILNLTEKAIFYYPEPYYLKKTSSDLYRLSAILCLASILVAKMKGSPPASSSIELERFLNANFNNWQRNLLLKELKFSLQDLNLILAKYKETRF